LWLRPGDLSLSLSNIENNERLQGSADLDHVYGVGFFLGGTSMLSLAGAQFDPGLYQASCEQQGVNVDCAWLRENDVDLATVPAEILQSIKRGERIKSVIAINPELTKAFKPSSFDGISVRATVLDIRGGSTDYPGLDLADSIQRIPGLSVHAIPDASLLSAFSLCTRKGAFILAAEGEENICQDPAGLKRAKIHQLIIDEIVMAIQRGSIPLPGDG
jgi:predicted dienelactone hydrolase